MSALRLWMVMWIVVGAMAGYIVSSGIGVIFLGALPFPLVDRIWWIPIPTAIFLFVFRITWREELCGKVKDDKEVM